ncbi:class F sortase [Kitasatospora indigofera]|uniref:class F sortase n=1 Tax=Kitasatospora indigofera TaxID=67307 RepID=UPI0036AE0920
MNRATTRTWWTAATVALLLVGALAIAGAIRAAGSTGAADFGSTVVAAQPSPSTGPLTEGPLTGGSSPSDSLPTGAPSTAVQPLTSPAPTAEAPPAVSPPRVLIIPRLGVRAPVDAVGVAGDGSVEVPGDVRRVGWYRYGTAPGAPEGSALLVGHVDSRTQGLGVLARLAEVREGDTIEVGDDGSTVRYRVVSRRTLLKADLADSGAFRREGPPVLTLVTCTGPFLGASRSYRDNLVVTAVPDGS